MKVVDQLNQEPVEKRGSRKAAYQVGNEKVFTKVKEEELKESEELKSILQEKPEEEQKEEQTEEQTEEQIEEQIEGSEEQKEEQNENQKEKSEEQKEQVKEVNEVWKTPKDPSETPLNEILQEAKPVASPIDLGTYHVTNSLDPSVVIQQTAAHQGIPLSLEDVDHLVKAVDDGDVSEELVWRYIDAQGFERGPFDSSTMRTWWDNGFLTQSLAVKYKEGSWRPIQTCYISLENVFLEPPMEELSPKSVWKEPIRHSATERRVREMRDNNE